MRIHLHIERLVLDRVPADQPRILRQAIEQELTSRLLEGGLCPELRLGGAVPKVRGGAITLGHGTRPARLGTEIAGAIYHGIGAKR